MKRRLHRGHAWGAAVTASAASPLLAQAGPALDTEPLYLLIGGIVGPGCTLVLGEVTRSATRAVAAYTLCSAEGGGVRACVAAAARAVLEDQADRPQLPPPPPEDR